MRVQIRASGWLVSMKTSPPGRTALQSEDRKVFAGGLLWSVCRDQKEEHVINSADLSSAGFPLINLLLLN